MAFIAFGSVIVAGGSCRRGCRHGGSGCGSSHGASGSGLGSDVC